MSEYPNQGIVGKIKFAYASRCRMGNLHKITYDKTGERTFLMEVTRTAQLPCAFNSIVSQWKPLVN